MPTRKTKSSATKSKVSKKPVTATVKKPVNKTVVKPTKAVKQASLQDRVQVYLDDLKLRSKEYWETFKGDKRLWAGAVLLGILLLAVTKKELFIAGMVNGKPISNLEVQQRLNEQFKSQVVNQLADERVIRDEANSKGVSVSSSEIDTKIQELESNFGGAEVLDSLLTQQGQTRAGLRKNLELQVLIEKLYSNEATVSAEEIDQFLAQNAGQLQATDEAAQRKEAEDQLKQQKLGQLFSQKFQELKQKANIQIF